jgi:hypothetical protein
MELILKQKYPKMYKYEILNENNILLYEITKKRRIRFRNYYIYDFEMIDLNDNNKITFSIEGRRLFLIHKFNYFKNGEKIGSLKEQITWSVPKMHFTPKNWTVISDFFDWNNYKVYDSQGQLIMKVREKAIIRADYCKIEVENQEEILYYLMIIFPLINIPKRKRRYMNI